MNAFTFNDIGRKSVDLALGSIQFRLPHELALSLNSKKSKSECAERKPSYTTASGNDRAPNGANSSDRVQIGLNVRFQVNASLA